MEVAGRPALVVVGRTARAGRQRAEGSLVNGVVGAPVANMSGEEARFLPEATVGVGVRVLLNMVGEGRLEL